MKNFKLLSICVLILLFCIIFVGCTNNQVKIPGEEIKVNIATLKGPTGIGMVNMMENPPDLGTNFKPEFTIAGAPDELVGKVIKGEVQIAALPTNLAAVIFNKTEGQIQMAAINTLGVLYMVEKEGVGIENIEDLEGKTIYATGKGSTPEYILNYILNQNGFEIGKDLNVEYLDEHAELAAMVVAGDVDIALLPEPFVTTVMSNNQDIKIALDFTDEWDNIANNKSALAMGCIVVNKEFAQSYPEAIDAFLKEYKTSVEYTNEKTVEASMLVEKFGIMPKAKLAELAIPKCNIVFMNSSEGQEILDGFYDVLFEFNPKSVGGNVPDDSFYYKQEK